MFAEYENYLNEVKEFDNYWSDVGISEAVSMLEKFSANDWQMLNEKIQDKSKVWLVSCAETLGDDVGGGSSFDLLLKLLSSEINEVKIAALDSINSRAISNLKCNTLTEGNVRKWERDTNTCSQKRG